MTTALIIAPSPDLLPAPLFAPTKAAGMATTVARAL